MSAVAQVAAVVATLRGAWTAIGNGTGRTGIGASKAMAHQ
jgi:hypothetical protein